MGFCFLRLRRSTSVHWLRQRLLLLLNMFLMARCATGRGGGGGVDGSNGDDALAKKLTLEEYNVLIVRVPGEVDVLIHKMIFLSDDRVLPYI